MLYWCHRTPVWTTFTLPLSSVSTKASTLMLILINVCDLEHRLFIFSLSFQWSEQAVRVEDSLTVLTNLNNYDRTGDLDWHSDTIPAQKISIVNHAHGVTILLTQIGILIDATRGIAVVADEERASQPHMLASTLHSPPHQITYNSIEYNSARRYVCDIYIKCMIVCSSFAHRSRSRNIQKANIDAMVGGVFGAPGLRAVFL